MRGGGQSIFLCLHGVQHETSVPNSFPIFESIYQIKAYKQKSEELEKSHVQLKGINKCLEQELQQKKRLQEVQVNTEYVGSCIYIGIIINILSFTSKSWRRSRKSSKRYIMLCLM